MIWGFPPVFWGLTIIVPLMLATHLADRKSQDGLKNIGLDSIEWKIRVYLRNLFMGIFFVLSLLAMADPRSGRYPANGELKGLDVAVAFDVSRSMLAEDITPNRLNRSITALAQIVQALGEARFSLIPFKGNAVSYVPMTEDRIMLNSWMAQLDPGLFSSSGTNIEAALETAHQAFPDSSGRNRIIILITDGESLTGKEANIKRRLFEEGIPVYVLVAGTEEGTTIPLGDGKNVTDESGRVVISRADSHRVGRVATGTGGSLYNLDQTGSVSELIGLIKKNTSFGETRGMRFMGIYRYRRYLLPALFMLLLYLLVRIIPWRKH